MSETTHSRIRRSLVAIGAFGTAGYVKRHPERIREKVLELRGILVARNDSRVSNVDRIIRLLDRDGAVIR